MEQQKFEQIKQTILGEMQSSGVHCRESMDAVAQCYCTEDFVRLIRLFSLQLQKKDFPTYEIMQMFKGEADELAKMGVFIDKIQIADEKIDKYFLFGASDVIINIKQIKAKEIHLYNISKARVDVCQCGICKIVKHGSLCRCSVDKGLFSRVRIKQY